MADSVSERITVAADPATVLQVVRDVAAYPAWQSETKEAEVLGTDPEGRPARARLLIDAGILRTTMVLDYRHSDQGMSWTLVEGDQLRRNDGRYEVVDQGDGTTELTYSLDVEPTVPLPGMIRRRAAKRIVDTALRGAKARAESQP
jgi:ribosome-associated toxin RatA of RatAB toxin-antitoxin module